MGKVYYNLDQLQNINNRKPLKEELITETEMFVFINRVKQYESHQRTLSYFLADFPRKWNYRNANANLKHKNIFDHDNTLLQVMFDWNKMKERVSPTEALYLCEDIGFSGFHPLQWNQYIKNN